MHRTPSQQVGRCRWQLCMTHDGPQAPRARRLAGHFRQAGVVFVCGSFWCALEAVCSTRGVPTCACFAVLCCVMLCWPAEMAFMFMERSQGRNRIDYPVSSWLSSAALLPKLVSERKFVPPRSRSRQCRVGAPAHSGACRIRQVMLCYCWGHAQCGPRQRPCLLSHSLLARVRTAVVCPCCRWVAASP